MFGFMVWVNFILLFIFIILPMEPAQTAKAKKVFLGPLPLLHGHSNVLNPSLVIYIHWNNEFVKLLWVNKQKVISNMLITIKIGNILLVIIEYYLLFIHVLSCPITSGYNSFQVIFIHRWNNKIHKQLINFRCRYTSQICRMLPLGWS